MQSKITLFCFKMAVVHTSKGKISTTSLFDNMETLFHLFEVCWNEHLVNYFSGGFLWSQYKFIAFNIFCCKSLIISCRILIITVISNETSNELTVFSKLCENHNILPRRYCFLISSAGKNVESAGIQNVFLLVDSLRVTFI